MRRTYNAMLSTADDETLDAFVDTELRRRPSGRLDLAARLNWLRREETFEEACGDAPDRIKAEMGAAVVALRRRAPEAAARLRALGRLDCRGNLALGLATLAAVGPALCRA